MKRQFVFLPFLFLLCLVVPCTARAGTVRNTSAFDFYFRDEGNNTCCITEIRINADKGISELKIPDTINGKTVVSIGPRYVGTENNDGIVQKNVFGLYQMDDCGRSAAEYWDWMPKDDAQKRRAMKVKKIILPDTIKVLKKDCFAAMKGLKSVKLPKNLTRIESEVFSCTAIKKIHLPDSLTFIEKTAFFNTSLKQINIPAKLKEGVAELARTTASWKRFAVSKKNPYYKVKKDFLFSKDGKTIYALIKPKKKIRIPDKVKKLSNSAFYNMSLKSVHLGAGLEEIEGCALSTRTNCKITLSSRNSYLAKKGMCIYNKKKKNLLVGIPKKSRVRVSSRIEKVYIFRISKKITMLDENFSIVGIGKKYKVRRVYIPKSVKTMPTGWSLGFLGHKKCTYSYV